MKKNITYKGNMFTITFYEGTSTESAVKINKLGIETTNGAYTLPEVLFKATSSVEEAYNQAVHNIERWNNTILQDVRVFHELVQLGFSRQ